MGNSIQFSFNKTILKKTNSIKFNFHLINWKPGQKRINIKIISLNVIYSSSSFSGLGPFLLVISIHTNHSIDQLNNNNNGQSNVILVFNWLKILPDPTTTTWLIPMANNASFFLFHCYSDAVLWPFQLFFSLFFFLLFNYNSLFLSFFLLIQQPNLSINLL